MSRRHLIALGLAASALPLVAAAQTPTPNCASCPTWNIPQRPFQLFGNSYYVGTHGLAAVLVTSPSGHVLIDGALPESAPLIAANIEALGFKLSDVRAIVNSHVHFDHAGGIAELQRRTGAQVYISEPALGVMHTGQVGRDDPQFGEIGPIAPVPTARAIPANDTLQVGSLTLVALRTAGHAPGGTSWSWTSCEGERCRAMVYGDSQSSISAEGFLFTRPTTYPRVLDDFEAGFAALERVRCEILVTPHPEAMQLWERLAKRETGERDALVDTTACKRYAAGARERLSQRLKRERETGRE
jgi:metallo-beta-lactamase class B